MRLFWKSRKVWYWLAALAMIFILHFSGLTRPLENYLFLAIKPFAAGLQRVGEWSRGRPESAADTSVLLEQLDRAKADLAAAIVDQAKLQLLEEENKKLRMQLDFVNANDYRVLSANIVSRQNLFESAEDAQDIVLDKGSSEGLRPGLGVIDESGVIIGKIVEVKDHSARACLTTGTDCQLPAAIINSAKTIGLAEGELGLTIKMNYIPQLEDISQGDIIITSGLGGDIPRGLVIGRVAQVNKQSNEIWQDVTIEPLSSLRSLTIVSVILP
ncbi:MAG: rod shape-determining protein MreC [Patescibacteria group bacterium]|nr:rod shape-determining protein MreC [Patescibacteria group bacterium]